MAHVSHFQIVRLYATIYKCISYVHAINLYGCSYIIIIMETFHIGGNSDQGTLSPSTPGNIDNVYKRI